MVQNAESPAAAAAVSTAFTTSAAAAAVVMQCAKHYDPDSCPHDSRPECDYSKYRPGEYPPDSCRPYKVS
jgi:hypothetical protein